jgi:hypothetical protein
MTESMHYQSLLLVRVKGLLWNLCSQVGLTRPPNQWIRGRGLKQLGRISYHSKLGLRSGIHGFTHHAHTSYCSSCKRILVQFLNSHAISLDIFRPTSPYLWSFLKHDEDLQDCQCWAFILKLLFTCHLEKKTKLSGTESELYWPSNPHLSVKLLPTFCG